MIAVVMRRSANFKECQKGAALVPTILLTGILILLVTSMSVFMTSGATSIAIMKSRLDRDTLIGSALNFGMGRILSTPRGIAVEGSDRIKLRSGEARIEWRAETARLNINYADSEFIASILLTQGMSRDAAKQLATLIAARRALDVTKPIPKDLQILNNRPLGPYIHLRDLLDVPGMTHEIFTRISPFLTVYGNSTWMDPRIADPDLLRALPDASGPEARDLLSLRGLSDNEAKARISSDAKWRRYLGFDRLNIFRFRIEILPVGSNSEIWDIVAMYYPDDERPYRIFSISNITSSQTKLNRL